MEKFEHIKPEESISDVAAETSMDSTLQSLATSELYSKESLTEDLRQQMGTIEARIKKLEQYQKVKNELKKLYSDNGPLKSSSNTNGMIPEYEQILTQLEQEIGIPTDDIFIKTEIVREKGKLEHLSKLSNTTSKNITIDPSLN